jgi:hypothetical protein
MRTPRDCLRIGARGEATAALWSARGRLGTRQRVILPPDRRQGQGVRTRYRGVTAHGGGKHKQARDERRDRYHREGAWHTKRSECASACQPEHHHADEPDGAPSPGCSVQEVTHHRNRQSRSRSSELRVSTRARTFLCRHGAKAFLRRRSGFGAAQWLHPTRDSSASFDG